MLGDAAIAGETALVVVDYVQGPPGPPGPPGDRGQAGYGTQVSYALTVQSPGQTIFPLTPPPTVLSTVTLWINGKAEGAPDVAASETAATWGGPYAIALGDDVRVTYF